MSHTYSKVVGICATVANRHGLEKKIGSGAPPGGTIFAVPKRLGNYVGPSIYVAPAELSPTPIIVVSGVGSNTPGRDQKILVADLQRALGQQFGAANVRVEPYHWTEF